MPIPQSLLESLTGAPGFNREAFEKVHASAEQITSIRLNPLKLPKPETTSLRNNAVTNISWSQFGYYLKSRPSFTFDPVFHAGCYYVQEASSMFLEQALVQLADLSLPLKILDLSAAPGGKSTHIQSLISKQSLLVSNEVIRSRANILKDNIIKWGAENVVVTNNDPKDFARLENYFDIIVVDAPCSGSGLFRREPTAIEEWSLNNVQLCSQRQQRILADVWPALKKGGILIYSTCSYSTREDEAIMDWMTDQLPCENLALATAGNWDIVESLSASGNKGYRFWPYKVKGEGFFLACFRKTEGPSHSAIKVKKKPDQAARTEIAVLKQWIDNPEQAGFIKNENTLYAWPHFLLNEFSLLQSSLRVIYSGIRVGEFFRDKLVPDHALAMSTMVHKDIGSVTLDYDESINYLKRKNLHSDMKVKGWQLVKYEGFALGWINALSNRINNYYPKELRILKDI
jgi:16S rRNA C967 or C1407 C5-methylase (RsmB/RsmF family)/NOL1/NOP2/fmu family ribosome biogenesis protein